MFQMSDDKRGRGRGRAPSMDGPKSRSRKLDEVKKKEVRRPGGLFNTETSGMDLLV